MADAEDRVKKCVEALDSMVPDWFLKVETMNTRTLLEQVFGSSWEPLKELERRFPKYQRKPAKLMKALGLDLVAGSGDINKEYREAETRSLNDALSKEVEKRLAHIA